MGFRFDFLCEFRSVGAFKPEKTDLLWSASRRLKTQRFVGNDFGFSHCPSENALALHKEGSSLYFQASPEIQPTNGFPVSFRFEAKSFKARFRFFVFTMFSLGNLRYSLRDLAVL